MIVTPRQFTQRGELYRRLAQLTSAGISLRPALEQIQHAPPAHTFREPLRRLLAELERGSTFSEAAQHANWLPAYDLALLDAGERSGRLDACFGLLADHYTDRARVLRQVLADLAYPVFVYHCAVCLVALLQFLRGAAWLPVLLVGFIPVYAGTVFLVYAGQSRRGERWRALVESLLRPVPVLGSARQYLALSRLAAALEALLSAGVTIIEAWELAARASGSPALRRAVLAWRPQVAAGQTPSEAVRESGQFPEIFTRLYASGEISGKLDDSLRHLHRICGEEGTHKLHLVSQWVPRGVYFTVILIVAVIVLRFWIGYFNQINTITNGF
ncbi:MAG: type II secretion system F family protein [Verrucomicrobiota bacterium]|nr:type II secretion system F family protein [Verrucomicrobiota bacterium]